MQDNTTTTPQRVHVWDLPTRLFHWVLVFLVVVSVVSVKIGNMEVHEKSGIALLTLIAFRIVWGFVGGRHARFANFVRGPGAIKVYLASMKNPGGAYHLGHNPLGALSVIALILSVGTQAVTGLFADDEIATQGPLASKVTSATTTLMTRIHHFNEKVIYALVALHILAILYYAIAKKDNLVHPMVTGYKTVPVSQAPADTRGSPILAVIVLAVIAALVYYFIVRK